MGRETIKDFYSNGTEKDRLEQESFQLEGMRTKKIIGRYLANQRMAIADIGGGAGHYAFWLQSIGHGVTLVDLSLVILSWWQNIQNALALNWPVSKQGMRPNWILATTSLTWCFY